MSLVQTHSIQNAVREIDCKIEELEEKTRHPVNKNFPNNAQLAQFVLDEVQKLAQAAKDEIRSGDKVLQQELKPAYEETLMAAQFLLPAAKETQSAVPPVDCRKLYTATNKILEGTVKILMAWDRSEVRKIAQIAQQAKDKLRMVQAAQSMRALVVCYNGFFESMMTFIELSKQRYKDLINASRKDKIFECLITIRKTLEQFSCAMQDFVKNPKDNSDKAKEIKDKKDHIAECIVTAIDGIVEAVTKVEMDSETATDVDSITDITESTESSSDETVDNIEDNEAAAATLTMATHLQKAQKQLTHSQRHVIGPELDTNLNAIINNSKAVAKQSNPVFQQSINELCEEVLSIRKELGLLYDAHKDTPDSEEARQLFNTCVDNLCTKLQDLDKAVANSVAGQVAEAYVRPSVALDKLMGAVEEPSSPPADDTMSSDSVEGLTRTVELFRQQSRRLSNVAMQAAQGTLNRRRSKRIKKLTDQLDDLTQKVVSAAHVVRSDPQNSEAREQLNEIRKEWAEKVKALTAAIDEIINVENFTAATEATIVDDMQRCRDAVQEQNREELIFAIHNIAAKARRVSDVAKRRTSSWPDSQLKTEIREGIKALEIAVKEMTEKSEMIAKAPKNQPMEEEAIIQSLENVLTCIHNVQDLLPAEETMELPEDRPDGTVQNLYSTSTPLTSGAGVPVYGIRTPIDSSSPPTLSPFLTDERMSGIPSIGQYEKHAFSPSDDWIKSTSFEETTPSSFASTNPSAAAHNYPGRGDHSLFQTPLPRTQPVTYPSSLGGYSLQVPSYQGTSGSWQQSDLSPPTGVKKTSLDSSLLESYAQPLRGVVSAATQGNHQELQARTLTLTRKAEQLTEMAESTAATSQDPELARILNKESAELKYLTPHIVRRAEEVLHQRGQEDQSGDDLGSLTQLWAGHVRMLLEASQDANKPWSQSARRLVSSAKARKGLDEEISHIGSQTERMVSIATTTIKAATIEDAIGSTVDLEQAADPMVQDQIDKVKNQIETIETVTPDFISTAQEVAHGNPSSDKLNLLSNQWATAANVLMREIDDITIGMSGPADSLLIAANSNDSALLEEQASSIQALAKSMLTISHDAVQGCTNEEQVQSVLETAEQLQQLSVELVQCARHISSKRKDEQQQLVIEKAEVLRRDWAAKMHLLTAHIDDLTAEVAGPLDRLVSVALQAARTEGMAKDHLMEQFAKRDEFFTDQLDEVNSQLGDFLKKPTTRGPSLHKCVQSMAFLKEVTPHAIGAARLLATDPNSAKLDHFSHLRRQWTAKAQSFRANILEIAEESDVSGIVTAFEDLVQGYKTTRTTPSAQKVRAKRQTSSKEIQQQRYYSTEDLELPSCPPPPIPADDTSLVYKPGAAASRYPRIDSTTESTMETSLNNSLVVAARTLHDAVDDFMEEGNPLVSLAKRMSHRMFEMAEFTRGRGHEIKSMEDMISTSKAIAEDANQIVHYAKLISNHCADKRIKNDLQYCVGVIPTMSNQLNIIASVKFSTLKETDTSRADKILEKNAQNLMSAVVQTIQAAEAAYVKGLTPPADGEGDSDTTRPVIEWKRKLHLTPLTIKGLRKLKKAGQYSPAHKVLPQS